MNWIITQWLSHLEYFGIASVLLISLSFCRIRIGRPRILSISLGIILLAFTVGGGIYLANSAPGQEEVVVGPDRPNPKPPLKPSQDTLAVLRENWDSEGYADWPAANRLATISMMSYLPPYEAEPRMRSLGFDRVTTIVAASMVGYVASQKDVTVIVFRGTDDTLDWFTNLNELAVQTPHGQMHKGFFNAYQSLKQQVGAILEQNPPKYLWITGHSLGGAIAVVCAYDLTEEGRRSVTGVITFGQPMVVRKPFTDYMDKLFLGKFVHFVNDADIVARIPPSYAHCGSLVWFTKDGVKRSRPKRPMFDSNKTHDKVWDDSDDIPPLSQSEFEQYKAEIRTGNTVTKSTVDEPPTYGAMSSLLDDHSMNRYFEKVRDLTNHEPTR